MHIKPTYEAAAGSNENENMVFTSVNGNEARDACMAFQIEAYPTFIFFLNGKQYKTFRGANESKLF